MSGWRPSSFPLTPQRLISWISPIIEYGFVIQLLSSIGATIFSADTLISYGHVLKSSFLGRELGQPSGTNLLLLNAAQRSGPRSIAGWCYEL